MGIDELLQPVDAAWDAVLAPYLEGPLWSERDAYDAGHTLMVPLHAAVALGKERWVAGLRAHFERLDAHWAGGGPLPSSRLTRFQYLYLVTRASALSGDRIALVPDRLREEVGRELRREWRDVRVRILQKAAGGLLRPTRRAAISDELLFALALAADLGGRTSADDCLAEEALDLATAIVSGGGVTGGDGGWLLQPDARRDHPDYAYARHLEKVPGMAPLAGQTGAWDSSHGARLPLWLRSFQRAAGSSQEERPFRRALAGLRKQFLQVVLTPPSEDFPLPRLRNFLDGNNGVYRWGYASLGADRGYGPYELSGVLGLGWWSFLGGTPVSRAHAEIARAFPLPEDAIDLYCGPITKRDRHPLVREPDCYRNGLRELLTRLAAALALAEQAEVSGT